MSDLLPIYTDRSRIECYEECPRKRWWAYEYKGLGVDRKAVSVPLVVGGYVHEPLSTILTVAQHEGWAEASAAAGACIADAVGKYMDVVAKRGLLLDYFDGGTDADIGRVETSPTAWQVNEQLALMEALVKGWTRVQLPRLMDEYEIVCTEKEIDVPLEETYFSGEQVVLMARPDAILKRKATGEYFVLSFKTTSNPDKTWMEQHRYSMQVVSEFVAARHFLGKDAVVRGVLLHGLVKGGRSITWPEGSEQRRHNSPLLYHFEKPAMPPLPASYKAAPYYTCAEAHPWRWAKGGHCPGGQKHKIGDDYRRNMVAQTCGIDTWLDWLNDNEPALLQAQFVELPTLMRSEYEIQEWIKQTVAQEGMIHGLRSAGVDVFPKHTSAGNCVRPSRCDYIDLCWGVADPDDPSQFVMREPNHPQEVAK